MRDEISGSQVKRFTKDMKANEYDENYPIDAANVDGKLIILDDHRAEAASKAGIKDVPVNVHSVTKEEADQLMREAAEARVRY
ncbi:ParB N-terminal domain-containing protein [Pseudomonas yamanorum]|uniref:ParB N-terminal domain-containing protein n=1 Tax=Pseudomonas yamanorum TaxID=515393 RepID=UPI003D370000